MKYKSALMTEASGSLRGIVASHNAGGAYFRGRSTPTNPRTSQQQAVRNAVAQIAAAWTQTLTVAQRTAWDTFAKNVPITDALGNSINIPAMAWYNKANAARLQAGLTRVDAAPTEFALIPLTLPTVGLTAGSANATVTFTVGDSWHAAGGGLMVYASRPQNLSINSPAGLSYRFAGLILGTATSPQTLTLPFGAAVANSNTFFRAVASGADGRPSGALLITKSL